MRNILLKFTALLLIAGLNWFGLSMIGQTQACFNDTETSSENTYTTGTLDFSLDPTNLDAVFLNDAFNIDMNQEGSLPFQYTLNAETSGDDDFCNNLILFADLNGVSQYSGLLKDLNASALFSDPQDIWSFVISDPQSNYTGLTCNFEFIFKGEQEECVGFSDEESAFGYVGSEEEPPPLYSLVINEVYYDVLEEDKHCTEAKNEWIELYNPTENPINLKNWQLCHGGGCNTINPNVDIPADGFAVVGHNNSTWVHCWSLPPEIVTIHQLGGQWVDLGNDGDYVILKDPFGQEVDCVCWGNDNTCKFSDDPVTDVIEGHSIARHPAGHDTDTAADWKDLTNPNPGTNPHSVVDEQESSSQQIEETNEIGEIEEFQSMDEQPEEVLFDDDDLGIQNTGSSYNSASDEEVDSLGDESGTEGNEKLPETESLSNENELDDQTNQEEEQVPELIEEVEVALPNEDDSDDVSSVNGDDEEDDEDDDSGDDNTAGPFVDSVLPPAGQ